MDLGEVDAEESLQVPGSWGLRVGGDSNYPFCFNGMVYMFIWLRFSEIHRQIAIPFDARSISELVMTAIIPLSWLHWSFPLLTPSTFATIYIVYKFTSNH